jgi:hypothetical protein
MLVAVLLLALFGLWSVPVVALLSVQLVLALRSRDEPGEAGPQVSRARLACTVCGSHYFSEVEADQHRRQRDDGAGRG